MVATVHNLTSSSATAQYFRQDAGYYLRKGEDAADLRAKRAEHRNASTWHGQGAVALGLHPGKPVAAGAFEKLLQGHVIGTRIRLGRLRDGQREHRPGFDITFSAPKSVSLAALLPTKGVDRRRCLTPWNLSESTPCCADRRPTCTPNNSRRG